jgi:hypothetical protein
MTDPIHSEIPDAAVEAIAREIAAADDEDYMEDHVRYDKCARAAFNAGWDWYAKMHPPLPSAREERLAKALRAAQGELAEAADKFWVIHCNHPGEVCGRAQGEDKAFLATMSKRMQAASVSAVAALASPAVGEEAEPVAHPDDLAVDRFAAAMKA